MLVALGSTTGAAVHPSSGCFDKSLAFGQQELMDNSDCRPTFVCFELWVGLGFFFLPVSFSSDIFNSDQLSPLGSEES